MKESQQENLFVIKLIDGDKIVFFEYLIGYIITLLFCSLIILSVDYSFHLPHTNLDISECTQYEFVKNTFNIEHISFVFKMMCNRK